MFWKRSANENLDLPKQGDTYLENKVGGFEPEDINKNRVFREKLYKELYDLSFYRANKAARKQKIPAALFFAAVAIVGLELCMTYCIGLSNRNPAAGELLKRRIKEQFDTWYAN